MRFIWARTKNSPQPPVDRLHFVMWDFLKMLTLAALCGLGISIAASLFVILLSSPAEASIIDGEPRRASVAELPAASATPGFLLVGDGCDVIEIQAIERDWHVRVHDRKVEVRVMQTFVMPAGDPAVGVFQVQLPYSANLKALSVQSGPREWPGKLISNRQLLAMAPADYRREARQFVMVATDGDGLVTTSPLMAMQDDESLVVQYTYTIHDTEAGRLALQLEADAVPPDATGDEETESDGPNRLRVRAARSAVWVEWMGAKPTQVSAPAGTEIDRVQQRVHGLSWAAPATAPGAHFVVTWSR